MKLASIIFASLALAISTFAHDVMHAKKISYELDGVSFEGTLVYSEHGDNKPGVLMIPNWMGPTEGSLKKAKKIAGDDYVVFMADMYGVNLRPSNGKEAGQAAGAIRADRPLMRARAAKALEVLKVEGSRVGLDKRKTAAIGFCFGGGAVLELGRSGSKVDAVVSFHGDLISPTLESDAANTTAKVLVLHGADDPYVPQDHVQTFVSTMQDTKVDWQLIQYSDTVHSFTNPAANSGGAKYNKTSANRSFSAMNALFEEIWD
ncbi:dienelactone hydrolase family protein [Pelagicoccus mobilis]|uniref:Dienelactone hydrolase family protein n=1 Tax=Pelagicoccus mobilis TaxID=415221 RepID=A0A934RS05_9BACT|nr:dienelactone hydrolase family protein [Pelagicoccus mobilis]MBK1876520.1 dienelactone hydrolase family protein [Pelagicoccus mobilis]